MCCQFLVQPGMEDDLEKVVETIKKDPIIYLFNS